MICSMTGFGRAKISLLNLNVTVEIKSVNHRYFEFSSRVPRAYMFLDEKLKSICQEKISRGKIEVFVQIDDLTENNTVIQINKDYADPFISALKKFSAEYNLKNDMSVSDFVNNSDMFKVEKQFADDSAVTEAVTLAANSAIDGFIEMRTAEGQRMAEDVISRTGFINSKMDFIDERSPETVRAYRERIEQRIKELLGDVQIEPQRLLTETAIFAEKTAVAEETVRLRSHIKHFCDILNGGGAVGRKLDFIVQEMNREANTIGSKSQDIEINRVVVDIKSEIEKIREQIQNIE